jgi:hypothetical protein
MRYNAASVMGRTLEGRVYEVLFWILSDTRAADSREQQFSLAAFQCTSAYGGEAAARTHQRLVDIPDIRQWTLLALLTKGAPRVPT